MNQHVPANVVRLRKALSERGAQKAFAKRIKASEGLVSKWRRGLIKPLYKWRGRLVKHGYPMADWD